MLYQFEDKVPIILAENYFIAYSAEVIGEVIINNNVTILPNAVVRADNDVIDIGENTNIQDGAVLHTDPGICMKIGKGVTIAHNAMLHGCTIGDNSVIAIGAVIMNNAVIGNVGGVSLLAFSSYATVNIDICLLYTSPSPRD